MKRNRTILCLILSLSLGLYLALPAFSDVSSGDIISDDVLSGDISSGDIPPPIDVPTDDGNITNIVLDEDTAISENAVLSDDFTLTLPGGVTLTISEDTALNVSRDAILIISKHAALTISKGAVLNVEGTILNDGKILNRGKIKLIGDGTIEGGGELQNDEPEDEEEKTEDDLKLEKLNEAAGCNASIVKNNMRILFLFLAASIWISLDLYITKR